MVFIMQNYTNHSELLIGQFYFVENKAVSDEAALFIFEGDILPLYTFMALALSAPTIAEATAITILRILSQIDFFIFFD